MQCESARRGRCAEPSRRASVSVARWGAWLLAGLASLLFAGAVARALDVPELKGPVNDYAGLLSVDEQRALASKLETHKQATGHELTLLTVPSLEGDTIEQFSIRVAEKWKTGSKEQDNGLVLLVARDDRKTRIEVGYGLEGNITDAFSSALLREVLQPAFRENNYAGGLNQAFDMLMAKAQGIAIDPPKPSKARQRSNLGNGLVFGVILLIALTSMFGRKRRRRGGFFFGPGVGWGGGGGGWGGGGGGWGGGGGGGGGWGGGGGGFGGGGASGDW
jgi:uncharacterized protein